MSKSELTKKKPKIITVIKEGADVTPRELIQRRRTEELVLAFCGPLGSGVSTVARALEDKIKDYGYSTHFIKVSGLIRDIDPGPTNPEETYFSGEAKRIDSLQNGGNNSRQKYGKDVLALIGVKEIAFERQASFENEEIEENLELKKKSRRVAHVIDSLKHPEEVNLLRSVYGNMFYLFGVLCAYPLRKSRLERNKEIGRSHAELLMDRDESEDLEYGQKLIETLQHADFFVRNNHKNIRNLEPALDRYIKLILGDPTISPMIDEYAMYMAQSAALRSACLSRQVGAAIVNPQGDIVATGYNDVPKSGGGLYSAEDGENDSRCINSYNGKCWNDEYKSRIVKEIKSILNEEVDDKKAKKLSDKISGTKKIKGLLEFSRSVHAEMDAIVSVARNGNASLKDCTLFSTTFPCHNCARHIIAAGIKQVYYIEPFEKSLAVELHDDSLILEPSEPQPDSHKVAFSHFEGVAPRQYLNLFRYPFDKKEGGKLIKYDPRKAFPTIPKYLDTFLDYESKIIEHLKNIGVIKEQERRKNDA